jgi:class 3 adenylate cyclase
MEKSIRGQGLHSLMGYLPALVVKKIIDGELELRDVTKLPLYFEMKSVCLFADISGFTKLSETYSSIGRMGAEVLAFMLNRYMETISK